jgi:hypothetical protein
MPANTELKPMKLTITRDGDTWSKTVTVIETGYEIIKQEGLVLLPEMINKDYFDGWENQMKNNPFLNIVEVERFI